MAYREEFDDRHEPPHTRPESELKEGERRLVAVLFSDMKGFTSLSERADPEEVDALMNQVFGRFEAIVRKHGGSVEKYIGDAMVAVFGYPELHEDDAARAIDSALEFNALVRRGWAGLPPGLSFRSGVHAGLVTTGRRGDYDVVTGHTMAVAARLQSAAQPGGVLVSQAVREACERHFDFSAPAELSVKGKEEAVLAYQALSRRKALFSYAGPFVDRKEPLEFLTGEYLKHMRGRPRGVYVVGDGGIGKTRLVAEFWSRLRAFPEFNAGFVAVNPSSFGSAEYASVLHAAADFMDLRSDAGYDEYRAAAERLGLGEQYLADAYGLWKPEGRPAAESRFVAAVSALYDAVFSSGGGLYPELVVVDNARLMDEKSLEFFRGYLASAEHKPFVVLCDRAPDPRASRVFGADERLVLEPLGETDAAELARALVNLDGAALDDEAIALIVERSQGYPLFIEEYVKLARTSRDPSAVPDSVQTTILAALDRLEAEERSLAQKLSVFRVPFSAAFAQAVHERTRGGERRDEEDEGGQGSRSDAAEALLRRLAAERVLVPAGDGLWAFKHAIVRDAIYASLLHHNRRVLHGVAAELIRPQGRAADVFYHLCAAEDWAAARSFLVKERPQLPLESAALVQTLIEHCPEERSAELIELHFIKYATHFNNHHYEGLREIIQDMYALALKARNRFYLARCYHLFLTSYYMSLDYRTAVIYGRKALDSYAGGARDAKGLGDAYRLTNARGASNARYFLALSYLGLDDFQAAREVLAGIDRSHEPGAMTYAEGMAIYARLAGEHAEAARVNVILMEGARQRGDEDEVCKRQAVAMADALKDFSFDAAAYIDNPDRLYCGLEPELAVGYYAALGVAYGLEGKAEAAAKAFDSSLYYKTQARSDVERAQCGAQLAWAMLLAGRDREARAVALEALAAANRCRHHAAAFSLGLILAELALRDGERTRAQAARELEFFLRDAAVMVEAPVYRDRATMARFWFLAWLHLESCEEAPDDEAEELLCWDERDEYLERAQRLLREELAALPDDRCRELCLSLSVFGRIMEGE